MTHTGKENEGLMVGSMVPEQTIIKITGPISIVERIESVEAVVDVTGLPATSVKNCSLRLCDSAGNTIDPTYLNFVGKDDGIDVTVSMLHKKTIPLLFTYHGTPAEHYKIKEIEWKPEFIEIAGNSGVLAGMNSLQIPSGVVNVEGIDEEQQLVIDITPYLPSGVILADQTKASVLVIVELEYVAIEETPEDVTEDDITDTTEKEDSGTEKEPSEQDGKTESTDSSVETEGEAKQNNHETESEGDDNTESNS